MELPFAPVLEWLRAVRWARRQVEAEMDSLVHEARGNGATWQEVGDALGITRQAAHKRYAR